MDDSTVEGLREQLAARLRRVIGVPGVEAKELAAFDLLMSRRQFLKAAQYTAIAGFVTAGTPPTLWGRQDSELALDPSDVGLTASDVAAVTTATQLVMGTELFQEPVYAEPAVVAGQSLLHTVIEGARNLPKLQSRLGASGTPAEAQFFDAGYHYGQPELIQLEGLDDGEPKLVHYRTPWGTRQDGGQADGLVGDVIMTAADGLSSPSHVLTATSAATNRFTAGGSSGAAYLMMVVDPDAPGGAWVLVGRGGFTADVGQPPPIEYPVTWSTFSADDLGMSTGGDAQLASRIVDLGFGGWDGSGPPAAPVERLLYYRKDTLYVLGLEDTGTGTGTVVVTAIPYPDPNGWSFGHFDGDLPLMVQGGPSGAGNVLFVRQPTMDPPTPTTTSLSVAPALDLRTVDWRGTGWNSDNNPYGYLNGEPPGTPHLETLSDNYYLYTVTDTAGGTYHVHLGRFSTTVALFAIMIGGAGNFPPVIAGICPLWGLQGTNKQPFDWDTSPRQLSGGISKFGGFRFVMTDVAGELYIARQRRLDPDANSATPPYLAPVYGPYNANGVPRLTGYSHTSLERPPPGMSQNTQSTFNFLILGTNAAVNDDGPRNVMLNAWAAFATDESAVSNAVRLGENIQAAYAPSRYSWDSSHIAVTRSQSAEDPPDTFAAYQMVCNPVTKCWHERLIAVQTTPAAPGKNESGDHYQLSIGMANVYGQTVRPSDNPDMAIEVRSDVPTTVTDTTHNVYYDLDRYTSFIAAPDPANARLEVVIKATTMAEILYARLIDTTRLQPSDDDPSLLTSSDDDPPDWQPVNVSAQAQQRMGTGATTSVLDVLGDDAPVPDPTPYVTGGSLSGSMTGATPWQFKSGFSSSTPDLSSNLASYLNASGTNLVIASSGGNLGASDSDGVDPLTSMTSTVNGSLLGTSPSTTGFIYKAGTTAASITYDDSGKTPTQVGSIWSGISHALHDALHWLQHAATETIDALGSATVTMIQDTDAITAVVDKEIMKAVNGVEQELQQVVSTVEEYGNVLVNVVVSIVEASFIYQMIAEIIALISMFLHFEKMWNLKGDLQGRVLGILSGDFPPDESNPYNPPTVPAEFSSYELIAPYLPGGGSTVTGPSGDDAGSTLPGSVLTDVVNNPIVKKILNAIMKETNAALNAAEDALPIKFNVDDVDNVVDLSELSLDVFTNDFVTAVETLATDLLDALVDPEEFYQTITDRLQTVINELMIDADQTLKTVLDHIDDLAKGNGGTPQYATQLQNLLNANEFLEINLTWLADFLKLFGVDVGSGKVTLKATDAIFLPMAIVLWTTAYMRDGMVISKLDDIDGTVSLDDPTQGDYVLWDAIRLGVDFTLSTLTGVQWLTTATVPQTQQSPEQKIFLTVAPYLGAMRMLNDFAYTYGSKSLGAPPSTDPAWLNTMYAVERATAIWWRIAGTLTSPKGSTDTPWQTNVANVADILMYLVQTVVEAVVLVEEGEKDELTAAEIVTFVGKVMTRLQRYMRTMWGFFQSELEDNPETLTAFGTVIFAAPYGNLVQEAALAMSASTDQPPPPPGTDNPKRQGPPPGRPRRPSQPPGLTRRPSQPPEKTRGRTGRRSGDTE